MSTETQPTHEHDCDACVFLGNYATREHPLVDLYECGNGPGRTVIARYSSEGSDYSSGVEIARLYEVTEPAHPLAEAMRRAKAVRR